MPGNAELIGTTADGRSLIRMPFAISPEVFAQNEGGDEGDSAKPRWLHIVPAGPFVLARDGRVFQISSTSTVAAASELPLLLDWEHESESWFGSTEAAGWGEELELRADGIWMRTDFTPKGEADVKARAYRYLSPVLVIDEETRDVQQIVSVALTNKPALRMEQIGKFRERFSAQFGPLGDRQEQTSMKPEKRKELCSALRLAESATDDEILAAQAAQATAAATFASKLSSTSELFTSANAQVASLSAENTALTAQVAQLTADVAAAKAVGVKAEREAAITAMFEANKTKITPAQAVKLREMFAAKPDTFEAFVEFQLPTMVEIAPPAPASITPEGEPVKRTEKLSAVKVTDKEREMYRKRGMTDAEIDAAAEHMAKQKAQFVGVDGED